MAKIDDKSKALFIQRVVAFLIDVMLVSIFASLITIPITKDNRNDKLSEQAIELQEKYINKEISVDKYIDEYSDIYYKMSRNNGLLSLVTIILNILYFIVYQFYNGGKTLGKQLMKIRVVSNTSLLTMNQMVLRSLIINFILVDIIIFGFMLFTPKNLMAICAGIMQLIQYIVILISIFMVMFRKDGRGLHDMIANTLVIRD